ncbi:MAG TPA: RHS repeat-associated core domain-containing protein [Fimbriimonadaceae bacterium]|nr:RHS repeat-associated core domain-containing protein [Fimbriimonadaceae bacterium]
MNGVLIGESTGGVRTDYLTDALGSVTATMDESANIKNTYRYKPYGDLLAKTGTDPDPKFMWNGSTGSRKTGLANSGQYNINRHYGTEQAAWTSRDPLWPQELAYVYVGGNPTTKVDRLGLTSKCKCGTHLSGAPNIRIQYGYFEDKPKVSSNYIAYINKMCKLLLKLSNKDLAKIDQCITDSNAVAPFLNCPGLGKNRLGCIQKFCQGHHKIFIHTDWKHPYYTYYDSWVDQACPQDNIWVLPDQTSNVAGHLITQYSIRNDHFALMVHEMLHACGYQHFKSANLSGWCDINNKPLTEQNLLDLGLSCNDIAACCITRVMSRPGGNYSDCLQGIRDIMKPGYENIKRCNP